MAKSIIELSNGLTVGNFSSPHSFLFEDGSELPAATEEDAARGKLAAVEVEQPGIKGTIDIDLTFMMTDSCRALMKEWELLRNQGKVDIVLVPLPVKTAFEADTGSSLAESVFRVIRVRADKRKERWIHIDRFCV